MTTEKGSARTLDDEEHASLQTIYEFGTSCSREHCRCMSTRRLVDRSLVRHEGADDGKDGKAVFRLTLNGARVRAGLAVS